MAPLDEVLKEDVNTVRAQDLEEEDWHQPLIDYCYTRILLMIQGIRYKFREGLLASLTSMGRFIDVPFLASKRRKSIKRSVRHLVQYNLTEHPNNILIHLFYNSIYIENRDTSLWSSKRALWMGH